MLLQTEVTDSQQPGRDLASSRITSKCPAQDERWAQLDDDPSMLTQIAMSAWLGAAVATIRMVEAHRRIWARSFVKL